MVFLLLKNSVLKQSLFFYLMVEIFFFSMLSSISCSLRCIGLRLNAKFTERFISEWRRVQCNRLVMNRNSKWNTKNWHSLVEVVEEAHGRSPSDSDVLGTLRQLTHSRTLDAVWLCLLSAGPTNILARVLRRTANSASISFDFYFFFLNFAIEYESCFLQNSRIKENSENPEGLLK